ncbi:hypothetical protein D8674_019476 [Pyrus ussuriensis x Pyrus communis]|uniref:Uncharacterized protein n=1 Tax=Pyrus ussuriensis x Pyrus communis TaxID=2448454 RepID=A0A5N5GL21_9ROSA|nr:hypothetical protein D8674_019476 [Pyrus ussuriensis x Pyrus communis]
MEEVFSPEDARFQIMTDTLDQTLGHRHENDPSASSSRQRTEQVKTLTFEVAGLKEQIAA